MIMYGISRVKHNEPLIIAENIENISEYTNRLIERVRKIQEKVITLKDKKAKENQLYLNQRTRDKDFEANQIVVYRNLAIEKNSITKIKLIGPCIILKIDKCSALVQNLTNNKITKQHYTFLHKFNCRNINNLPENWENQILNSINRRELRKDIRAYPTEQIELHDPETEEEFTQLEQNQSETSLEYTQRQPPEIQQEATATDHLQQESPEKELEPTQREPLEIQQEATETGN